MVAESLRREGVASLPLDGDDGATDHGADQLLLNLTHSNLTGVEGVDSRCSHYTSNGLQVLAVVNTIRVSVILPRLTYLAELVHGKLRAFDLVGEGDGDGEVGLRLTHLLRHDPVAFVAVPITHIEQFPFGTNFNGDITRVDGLFTSAAVSYTHLTLPTSDLV